MVFFIRIAGIVVQINSLYDYIFSQCMNYIVPECDPDIIVEISEQDIWYEKRMAILAGEVHAEMIRSIRPAFLENMAVYRKIIEKMISFSIFLMHGSVIDYKGNAFMLTAKSGVGKTTVTRELLKMYPDAFVINGDKPLIRYEEESEQFIAYGTPWCGKERMNCNTAAPLKKIIILKRGDDEGVRKISSAQAFSILLQQTYRFRNLENMQITLLLLEKLMKKVEILQYTMKNYEDVRYLEVPTIL